jgi:hypothetical protein
LRSVARVRARNSDRGFRTSGNTQIQIRSPRLSGLSLAWVFPRLANPALRASSCCCFRLQSRAGGQNRARCDGLLRDAARNSNRRARESVDESAFELHLIRT